MCVRVMESLLYREYRRIFAMFLSIFCIPAKKIFFPGHFVHKLENEEMYTEQIFFLPVRRF